MIKKHSYMTKGTCSRQINLEYDDSDLTLKNIEVIGGCNGNLKGISSLLKGMKLQDIVEKLEGIKCGYKETSCPDQISKAIKEIL